MVILPHPLNHSGAYRGPPHAPQCVGVPKSVRKMGALDHKSARKGISFDHLMQAAREEKTSLFRGIDHRCMGSNFTLETTLKHGSNPIHE
ncbi:hypothetical protein TNIN_231261 [Trichonephila inaurata madagascariensis]|uniref:Uncharacterized protein n=1 Tax=Trichonephila inaurata madagascariensis TaxID=2747483 RepID=A0A8X6XUQ4_9ARAC|nr:hypothetical protein TNIN_231261 [Trichonephila inaurata madagascariensis]